MSPSGVGPPSITSTPRLWVSAGPPLAASCNSVCYILVSGAQRRRQRARPRLPRPRACWRSAWRRPARRLTRRRPRPARRSPLRRPAAARPRRLQPPSSHAPRRAAALPRLAVDGAGARGRGCVAWAASPALPAAHVERWQLAGARGRCQAAQPAAPGFAGVHAGHKVYMRHIVNVHAVCAPLAASACV